MQLLDRETGSSGRRRLCGIRLAPEGKKLVMRIGPEHPGQRGTRGADQPDVISTAVGGDDEVSEQDGRVWLDQHMRLLAFAGAGGGGSNDPAVTHAAPHRSARAGGEDK